MTKDYYQKSMRALYLAGMSERTGDVKYGTVIQFCFLIYYPLAFFSIIITQIIDRTKKSKKNDRPQSLNINRYLLLASLIAEQ